MKNTKLNASGCRDMTAYEAIRNISREEKRGANLKEPEKVYICSRFTGDVDANVANALRYCRFALSKGKFPIAPHCYLPRFMDDSNLTERELAMSFALRLLSECREIWVFGNTISNGMRQEINEAKRQHIRIRQFTGSSTKNKEKTEE